ncbi:hypothetical protein RI367_008140 [Sorochytrium milnesiophthora]
MMYMPTSYPAYQWQYAQMAQQYSTYAGGLPPQHQPAPAAQPTYSNAPAGYAFPPPSSWYSGSAPPHPLPPRPARDLSELYKPQQPLPVSPRSDNLKSSNRQQQQHGRHSSQYRRGGGRNQGGDYRNGRQQRDRHSPAVAASPQSCDVCEKDFPNQERYAAHLKTHSSCSQCSFSASRSVVKQHELDVHGTGATGREQNTPHPAIQLDTPEKIAKWISQRRKNYPTDHNVQQKKEELQQRRERGELVDGPDARDRRNKRQRTARPSDATAVPIGDGEDGAPEVASSKTRERGAEQLRAQDSRVCIHWRRGRCRHGARCRYRHDPGVKKQAKELAQEENNKAGWKARPTLLQRLLDREIRQEQSHMLQCIRFLVKNDFFANGVVWHGDQLPSAAAAAAASATDAQPAEQYDDVIDISDSDGDSSDSESDTNDSSGSSSDRSDDEEEEEGHAPEDGDVEAAISPVDSQA